MPQLFSMQEFTFIDWIRSRQRISARVPVPAGDDLAVIKWDAGDLLLAGVDQVLDGVHFDSLRHEPVLIGRKAMNRNLSDCAAMGCLPSGALVSLAIPRGMDEAFLKSLYIGIEEAGARFDCPIVGGDTGSWDGPLAITVSIFGRSAGVVPVTRNGARVGDRLFVTGPLGGSILGRHLIFEPRVMLARSLAETGQVTAMIDLSDGLSRDIRHLLRGKKNLGTTLDAAKIPVHSDVAKLPPNNLSAVDHALHDGEDHELLFTTAATFDATAFPVFEIGKMTNDGEVRLETATGLVALEAHGWQHTF